MKRRIMMMSATLMLALQAGAGASLPPAPRGDTVDVWHGTVVPDPYRWLEDVDAADTQAWVAAQNARSLPYLAKLPSREGLHARLTELWNFPRHGVPVHRRGLRFFERNDGLQNQAVLWVEDGRAPARVLLDPNSLSSEGTVALTQWQVSPDGRYLAYGVAQAGSDWNTFHIRDVASGEDLADVMTRIKFSNLAWAGDSSGIFYSRYPDPPEDVTTGVFDDLAHQALYFHPLGADPADDVRVYAEPDHPKRGFIGQVSEDGRFLVVTVWEGASNENAVVVFPLGDTESPWLPGPAVVLVDHFDAQYQFIGSIDRRLFFLTSLNAPRGRIVSVDLSRRSLVFEETVAMSTDTLQDAVIAGDDLVLLSMRDARHRLERIGLATQRRRELTLPGLGTVSGLHGRSDSSLLHFSFASFYQPGTVYAVDLGQRLPHPRAVFPLDLRFDPRDYRTEQVFVRSKDGTRVPMFISYRAGLDRRQPQRVHLYGYGGFDVSLTPSFSVANLAWMEAGGVYAVANLRGGGEYGREWHQAGTQARKQNVFDDFVSAAGYLIAEGWTSASQLAISGRSNGGLLVGAVVNQHPQLFAAAVAGVGVMDMLRFHTFTIGWAWTGDYGSAEDPKMFPHLLRYSPYHNVRRGTQYPAVLVTTADHDDRVVPGHSYKYAAAMQWAQAGEAPILIRIDTNAGHGAGKPLSKVIDEAADTLAFMIDHTEQAVAPP